MLSAESIEILDRSLKIKYDEHVSKLHQILQSQLNKIVPNTGLPIIEILDSVNSATSVEIVKYGDDIKYEISKYLERIKPSSLSPDDKNEIFRLLDKYCQPELYKKRFDTAIDAITRKVCSYGIKFDINNYRTDLCKSSCHTGAENSARKIKGIIETELRYYAERPSNKTARRIVPGTPYLITV